MRIAQRIFSTFSRERLSYAKLYDLPPVRPIRARDFAELITFDPDPRHVTRDKRTHKSTRRIWHHALT
jgi:hypothetical protein